MMMSLTFITATQDASDCRENSAGPVSPLIICLLHKCARLSGAVTQEAVTGRGLYPGEAYAPNVPSLVDLAAKAPAPEAAYLIKEANSMAPVPAVSCLTSSTCSLRMTRVELNLGQWVRSSASANAIKLQLQIAAGRPHGSQVIAFAWR